MPTWLAAGGWGVLAGSALLVGSAVGYLAKVPAKVIASVMAFGAGVLLSAMSVDVIAAVRERGHLLACVLGLAAGATIYTGCNVLLAARGARHRKRSGASVAQPSEQQQAGSGSAIALGAFLDGVPESIVIGAGLLAGKGVSVVTVVAIFLSNLPEGLSSAAGMRKAGRTPRYVFGLWGGIVLASGIAAVAGYSLLGGASPPVLSGISALAAGAIFAMIADTMIPEAFDDAHLFTGLILVAGFVTALSLGTLEG